MQKHTAVLILVLGLMSVALATVAAAQQQATRLLVNNATKTMVELSQLVGERWQFRGRVYPGSSMPVYNVANGDRFRAAWSGGSMDHVVKLAYDRPYGGWQDVWTVK